MDLQQDLEQYRKTCKMRQDSTLDLGVDEDMEIVIRDLDHCRYKVEHISVKDIPSEVEASGGGGSDGGCPIIVHMNDHEESSPSEGTGRRTLKKTPASKRRANNQSVFSKDKDIPDRDGAKVYNFVMSKDLTLPHQLSPEDIQRLRRKWICIWSLALSTVFVVILVIIVLVLASSPKSTN